MENKVLSDQFGSHDMSGWLAEKTEFVIEALLMLNNEIDSINKESTMPYGYEEKTETLEEKVKNVIQYSFFDLTKIYSFALGGDWKNNDNEYVLRNGIEKLQVKYGLKEETSIHHEIKVFLERANELIQGERYPNRTLLYDILEPLRNKCELFKELDKELELVRDGQKSWESFVIIAKDILEKIEEKYRNC